MPELSDELVSEALRESFRRVLEQHRASGRPIVTERDGQIVWLDPHTLLPVPAPDYAKKAGQT